MGSTIPQTVPVDPGSMEAFCRTVIRVKSLPQMTVPAIMIHSLADARAALAAANALGVAVTLVSAPGAAAYGGAGWFARVVEIAAAEHPDVKMTAILDCDDAAGHVLGALRAGLRRVRFSGGGEVAAKLAEIARGYGALLVQDEIEAFDPRGEKDPAEACRRFLEGSHG